MSTAQDRVFEIGGIAEARALIAPLLARGRDPESQTVRERVSGILRDVQTGGDAAVLRYARELDGFSGSASDFRVDPDRMRAAYESLGSDLQGALGEARDRIRWFHERVFKRIHPLDPAPGVAGVRMTPIEKVGIYIPGGTASYPSTVLMTAVVAQVAGVGEIVGVSPGGKEGISPAILAAFFVAGVTRVFQVGGVQAIGALAYGTQSIPSVDKIVGPGNRYVAEAKRQVFGTVDIDMIAGPTEVLVLADRSGDPRTIAADLLAQAEHDVQAAAILISTDQDLTRRVAEEIESQIADLPRKGIIRESLDRFGFLITVPNRDSAVRIVDLIAPEHLELHVRQPEKWISRIRNAGAIFVGSDTAESFGDYCYGPSHVLPTNGSARFSSPVSVETFLKRTSILTGFASDEERESLIRSTVLLARLEGLEGHARSALIRSVPSGRV